MLVVKFRLGLTENYDENLDYKLVPGMVALPEILQTCSWCGIWWKCRFMCLHQCWCCILYMYWYLSKDVKGGLCVKVDGSSGWVFFKDVGTGVFRGNSNEVDSDVGDYVGERV